MGSVYLAEHIASGSLCVIKQIKNEGRGLAEQTEMIKIWQREVEVLCKLKHRGVVKFLDEHAAEDGRLYLVMEYVPGQNLDLVVQHEGALSSETVIRIAIQCCDVLEYLHSFEPPIIYRDLKPSNLMLRPDGLVVFIDFGIARDFEPKGPATRVVTSGYSPPEQYFGRPEPRGDLYSLGATMHHLLTGVRPKPLTSCQPKNINPGILPRVDNLVQRLTAHKLDERPPSARAVQYELFQIYKELHPDFVFPDLEEEMAKHEAQVRDEVRLSANLRSMNLHGASGPLSPQSKQNRTDSGTMQPPSPEQNSRASNTSRPGVRNVEQLKPGLFERVKAWVEGLTRR